MAKVPVYSAAKVGKQFFWVVLSHRKAGDNPEDALAEGFAPTKDDAWRAARSAAWAIAPSRAEQPNKACSFYRDHRGGAEEAQARVASRPERKLRHPETAEFQGSKHLYHQWRDDQYGIDHWSKSITTKVTDRFVYVLTGRCVGLDDQDHPRSFEWSWMENTGRLDRAKLEAEGKASHSYTTYYTKASMDAIDVQRAENKRRQEEIRQQRREEDRKTLVGKICVFCDGEPDRYTLDRMPSCSSCYKKAGGYYRVPPGMIVHFRTIGT